MNERKRTQTAETVRCHLWVRGIVQGVGFRMFAERAARRLGLAGLVRNLPDGRVEIVVEGLKVMLEAFIADVNRGPMGAVIRDVQAEWEPPAGLQGFQIH